MGPFPFFKLWFVFFIEKSPVHDSENLNFHCLFKQKSPHGSLWSWGWRGLNYLFLIHPFFVFIHLSHSTYTILYSVCNMHGTGDNFFCPISLLRRRLSRVCQTTGYICLQSLNIGLTCTSSEGLSYGLDKMLLVGPTFLAKFSAEFDAKLFWATKMYFSLEAN